MRPLYLIIGFFMCFAAGAFLYLWGMNRQKRKTGDLMNLLFANGVAKLKKYMKKHDPVTKAEVGDLMKGLTAKLPFSSEKAVVTDTKDFTNELLNYMVKTGQLTAENGKYTAARK